MPRVNVDSETPEILVDDVRLEEGTAATPPDSGVPDSCIMLMSALAWKRWNNGRDNPSE